ncbi:hypothetical protein PFISCL1PPCAC_20102, partial [Pristionchus fissidentatus]
SPESTDTQMKTKVDVKVEDGEDTSEVDTVSQNSLVSVVYSYILVDGRRIDVILCYDTKKISIETFDHTLKAEGIGFLVKNEKLRQSIDLVYSVSGIEEGDKTLNLRRPFSNECRIRIGHFLPFELGKERIRFEGKNDEESIDESDIQSITIVVHLDTQRSESSLVTCGSINMVSNGSQVILPLSQEVVALYSGFFLRRVNQKIDLNDKDVDDLIQFFPSIVHKTNTHFTVLDDLARFVRFCNRFEIHNGLKFVAPLISNFLDSLDFNSSHLPIILEISDESGENSNEFMESFFSRF